MEPTPSRKPCGSTLYRESARARVFPQKSSQQDARRWDGRIKSMAATHQLLSSHQWKGIFLSDLVRRELAPYAAHGNTEIGGPDVILKAEPAQAVSMVLHELTTNAAKHGALSTHGGRISVRWHRVMNGNADARLCIEWQ